MGHLNLFPDIIVRVATGPFSDLQALEVAELNDVVRRSSLVDETLTTMRNALDVALYAALPLQNSTADRGRILNLRRRLKSCGLNIQDLTDLVTVGSLPRELADAYTLLIQDKNSLAQQFDSIWEGSFDASRRRLMATVSTKYLDLISATSNSLRTALDKETRHRAPETWLTDTESGALKFFSRVSSKTSPFGRLTLVGLWSSQTSDHKIPELRQIRFSGQTRIKGILNTYTLLHYLDLLSLVKEYLNNTLVALNSGVLIEQESAKWVTNFANIDTLQSAELVPHLHCILEELQSGPKRFSDLINSFCSAMNLEEADAEPFLLELLDIGFLDLDHGFDLLSPDWHTKLADQIDLKCSASGLENISSRLRKITESLNSETQSFSQKLTELNQVVNEISSLISGFVTHDYLSETSPPAASVFKRRKHWQLPIVRERVCYEDLCCEIDVTIPRGEVNRHVQLINSALQFLRPFEGHCIEFGNISNFILTNYGKGQEVPALRFYDDFIRFKRSNVPAKSSTEQQSEHWTRPLFNEWTKHFTDLISPQIQANPFGPIDVPLSQLSDTFSKTGLSKLDIPVAESLAAYLQFYTPNPQLPGLLGSVLNNTAAGYGQMFGRFLQHFDTSVTDRMRSSNACAHKDVLLAELSDASMFSANIHPPLFPYELILPGGVPQHPEASRLYVRDIVVRWMPDEAAPVLWHKKLGRRVYAFDSGFLSISRRSQFFQVLSHFTLAQHLWVSPVIAAVNRRLRLIHHKEVSLIVRSFPRITLESSVVLQRQYWVIPRESFPRRLSGDLPQQLVRRIMQWRLQHNFPDSVFVTLDTRKRLDDLPTNETSNPDDFKPEYISFLSPIHILRLEKILRKCKHYVRFEEMLPSPGDLFSMGDTKHTAEFLVQWRYNSHSI